MWVRISIRARCRTLCNKVCQWLATGQWFSPGSPVSSTNKKTDRPDIAEIVLKVTLKTITLTLKRGSIHTDFAMTGQVTKPNQTNWTFILSDNVGILYYFLQCQKAHFFLNFCSFQTIWQLPYCLKTAEIKVVLIGFDDVLCGVPAYTVAVFYRRSTWNRTGIRKTMPLSVTRYNKTLPSQWNLIAQIEPVQDIYFFSSWLMQLLKTEVIIPSPFFKLFFITNLIS